MTVEVWDPALAFAAALLLRCEAGDTVLAFLSGQAPSLALAAPLRSESDRARFLTLARYLVRREAAAGYWLLAPMEQGGRSCLLIERGAAGGCRQAVVPVLRPEGEPRLGESEELVAAKPLLGDLFAGGGRLPGILRRQLDELATAIAIPTP